jgi:hypothetical protein
MNQQAQKFIENIIAEASLDSRILDGVVDIYNTQHVVIIAEKMYDAGIEEQMVDEFVEQFMGEGKYPERQAYNKEGWLVTFPSKEYRDAAIKKRTHFSSDPTHGKGGMNLYYKKKGKQKRQTQQAPTVTEPKEPSAQPKQQSKAKASPTGKPPTTDTPKNAYKSKTDTVGAAPSTESPEQEFERLSAEEEDGVEEKPKINTGQKSPQKDTSTLSSKQDAPAIDVPVVTAPPKQYSEVSKKFASQKRWVPTPYDEYHDAEGNLAAVVGLSGEIVPVKNTDREEYKIFAEKNMPT